MSILTFDTASAYAAATMSDAVVQDAKWNDDLDDALGIDVTAIRYGRTEVMTVWVEERADGTPYLYGEW